MLTEEIACWFFRLNGCLTIQNFLVHPDSGSEIRTDADVIAVRFPHRNELLTSGEPMQDHDLFEQRLQLFLVEVKAQECKLNGPWTDRSKSNVQSVLNAIGPVPNGNVTEDTANSLYDHGRCTTNGIDIRLVLVGTRTSRARSIPKNAVQLTYDDILKFIHQRMKLYFHQKANHQQWDCTGHDLYDTAVNKYRDDADAFTEWWRRRMKA